MCFVILRLPWAPPHHSFITCFVTMFATVIAITKDLPDVEGDMANNITTFATRLGVKNVSLLGEFWWGLWWVGVCMLFGGAPWEPLDAE